MSNATIVGSIGDVELRYTSGGKPVAEFSVRVTSKPREDGERPAFFQDVVMFDKQAERAAECLPKGTRVIVTGRLDAEQFQTKDGERTIRKLKLVGNEIGASLFFNIVEVPDDRRGQQAPAPTQEAPF